MFSLISLKVSVLLSKWKWLNLLLFFHKNKKSVNIPPLLRVQLADLKKKKKSLIECSVI